MQTAEATEYTGRSFSEVSNVFKDNRIETNELCRTPEKKHCVLFKLFCRKGYSPSSSFGFKAFTNAANVSICNSVGGRKVKNRERTSYRGPFSIILERIGDAPVLFVFLCLGTADFLCIFYVFFGIEFKKRQVKRKNYHGLIFVHFI